MYWKQLRIISQFCAVPLVSERKTVTFFGWEGVENTVGCGAGTCTHVWNYAQTVAFLFPELEQSMRRIEFLQETQADGYMPFRTYRPFGLPAWEMLPSADGQLGAVVRLYREWRLSGDNRLIEDCWDGVVRSMEYAIRTWDTDGILSRILRSM